MRTLILIVWVAVLAALFGARFRRTDDIEALIAESSAGRQAVISGELTYEFENSSIKVHPKSGKGESVYCWVEWEENEHPWWLLPGVGLSVTLSGKFHGAPHGRFGHLGGLRCTLLHPRVVVPPKLVTACWMMLATGAAVGLVRCLPQTKVRERKVPA